MERTFSGPIVLFAVFILASCYRIPASEFSLHCPEAKNCSSCVKMPACGWCSDNSTCSSIDLVRGCKVWNVKDCTEANCAVHPNCSTCLNDTAHGCFWCAGLEDASTKAKHPNRSSVCLSALQPNQTCGAMHEKVCATCYTFSEWGDCTKNSACGWCEGNGKCVEGDPEGPFDTQGCGLPYSYWPPDTTGGGTSGATTTGTTTSTTGPATTGPATTSTTGNGTTGTTTTTGPSTTGTSTTGTSTTGTSTTGTSTTETTTGPATTTGPSTTDTSSTTGPATTDTSTTSSTSTSSTSTTSTTGSSTTTTPTTTTTSTSTTTTSTSTSTTGPATSTSSSTTGSSSSTSSSTTTSSTTGTHTTTGGPPPRGPLVPLVPPSSEPTLSMVQLDLIIGASVGVGILIIGLSIVGCIYYVKTPYRYRPIG